MFTLNCILCNHTIKEVYDITKSNCCLNCLVANHICTWNVATTNIKYCKMHSRGNNNE